MPASAQQVFRFAPSPNGYLHLGHARSALLNYDLARGCFGRFLLRIEDIDPLRSKQEFTAAIEEDLAWLGLQWEQPVRVQSRHMDDYALALARLDARGLLYPCFCTRGDIARAVGDRMDWPRDPDGAPRYPGTCRALMHEERARRIAAGAPFARRIDMAKALAAAPGKLAWTEFDGGAACAIAANPAIWGDAVIARKDVPASYHLAVVVDDALQGVTDVVRGADLRPATLLHRLLQQLLGLTAPRYRHHPLILDEDGAKLAKSRLSKPLRQLRAEGASPSDIRRLAAL
jgi:glutamyl-Q tRNA(Asp) synthetase